MKDNSIVENDSGGWTVPGGTIPTEIVWGDPVEINTHYYITEMPKEFTINSGINDEDLYSEIL